jgi:hypothetical protein
MADKVAREVEALSGGDKPSLSDWDPLMAMNWNFVSRLLEGRGLPVMNDRGAGEDGMPENRDEEGFNHVCPLCVVQRDFNEHNTPSGRCATATCAIRVEPGELSWDQGWIAGCADSMLEYAVESKLVARH